MAPVATELKSLLVAWSLGHLGPIFEEEEITIDVLRYMATEPDFVSSMEELEVSAADAATILKGLAEFAAADPALPIPEAVPVAAKEPSAATAVAASEAAPPNPSLVAERIRVKGLVARSDLNGSEGSVLNWDGVKGRYTVSVDGQSVDLNLRPENIVFLFDPFLFDPEHPLIGERIRVKGRGVGDAFGCFGMVLSWNTAAGRYTVRVTQDDGADEDLDLKAENLEVAAGPALETAADEKHAEAYPPTPSCIPSPPPKPSAEVDDDEWEEEARRSRAKEANVYHHPLPTVPTASTIEEALWTRVLPSNGSEPKPATAPVLTPEAARATIAAAAQQVKLVPKMTKNGMRMVPVDNLDTTMAALAAVSAMGAQQQQTQPPPPAPPLEQTASGQTIDVSDRTTSPACIDSILASALASAAAVDASAVRKEQEDHEPAKPKVRSFTQINHVVPDGDGGFTKQSSVDRGTRNKALEAYKRRQVVDERKGKGPAYELDRGTMGNDEYKEVLERDDAKIKASGVNPWLSPNANDI